MQKNLEVKTILDNNLSSTLSIVKEYQDDLLKSENQIPNDKLKVYADKLNGSKIQPHKIGK